MKYEIIVIDGKDFIVVYQENGGATTFEANDNIPEYVAWKTAQK